MRRSKARGIFKVVLCHWLTAFVFMTLVLFLGAMLPDRSASLSAGLTLLFVSFFGDNLAGLAPALEPLQPFFPHSHFQNVVRMLTGPPAWGDMPALFEMGAGGIRAAQTAGSEWIVVNDTLSLRGGRQRNEEHLSSLVRGTENALDIFDFFA